MSVWITIPQAARMMGRSPDHFRRTFCNPADPVAGVALLVIDRPGAKYRKVMVLLSDIVALMEEVRSAS